ncbi:DUF488 domain-containing protein [Parvibaculum sp.]|uniref:DUF488 domain-containing protein n=1 Tax=Parvibaculum sp. TaxID=2024848 RepID=UPI002D15F558|nr:DUF488 domain-containing protein [Parvibaculum sp.]HUD51099.1 DUF488 domain-containing protein [Parvibaculum sp.]
MKLATIGYERRTLPELIERLKAADIDMLVDVRAVAASRRAGFSKTMLAASLREAGIDYVHLRALGTPKEGRMAARAGRFDEMREIFERQLEEPAAQLELLRAAEIVQDRKAALLCVEADVSHCHRAIVADRICDAIGCEIENL